MNSTAAAILKQVPSELLDSPVSDDHVAEIARNLLSWEGLAPFLKVNLVKEEEIKRSTPNDYGYQKRKLLQTWKQMRGSDATYRWLITALCCAENVELAEKVKVLLVPPDLPQSREPPDVHVLQTFRKYLIDCFKEDDLSDVQDELWDARSKWYNIGLSLGIPPSDLDVIDKDRCDIEDKFRSMLLKWLRAGKNCTWGALTDALSRRAVGRTTLAESIRQKLCQARKSEFGMDADHAIINVSSPASVPSCLENATEPEYATYRRLVTASCYPENVELAEKVKTLSLVPPDLPRSREPSDVLQMFREYLIDCWALRDPSREQWPLLGLSNYVELTLHEILSKKEEQVAKEVKLHQIFASSHKANRKFVLIEGAPGSGKTTLTWHMLQEWAEGKLFQQFSLLIPISLSNADPTVLHAICLADVIPHESKDMREKVAKAIAEKSGKGVCFLVDSWDEAPPTFFQQNSYFRQLLMGGLGKKNLPRCSIIVASRPVASATLLPLATSHVVISGFNSFSIEEFIDISLDSDEEKERFSQLLDIKPELVALCHLPLHISIVMHLFKTSNKVLPSTQTELYTAFVLSTLIRHRLSRMTTDESSFDEVTNFTDLPEGMVAKFRALCELAYTGVREQNTSFDKKVLKIFGVTESVPDTLSLMMDNKEIRPLGFRHSFSFLHYTIQEYMAAHHILSLGPEEQRKAVEELLKNSPMSKTLPFFAGLSKLENKDILNLLINNGEVPLNHHSVTEALKKSIHHPGMDSRQRFLALVDCIYESGKFEEYSHFNLPLDSDGTELRGEDTVTIYLQYFRLSPSHCLSLGYFLKHAVIKKSLCLYLNYCFLTDATFPLIATSLCSAQQLSCRLHVLDNDITHRGLECIRGGFGNNIQWLTIGGSCHPGFNPFIALTYLAEGLNRSPYLHCLHLFSNFTSEHKYFLLVLVISCRSLDGLSFSGCNLSGAIPILAAALKYRKIAQLGLLRCSLNDEDLYALGRVLYHCQNTLFVLNLTGTTFSSKALTDFLKAIRDSRCVLHTLYCEQYPTLAATQQEIVDDIQLWRKTHQMKLLFFGQRNSTAQALSKQFQDGLSFLSLPPDIIQGVS